MSLTTRERGLIHGGGLIFGWKNVLLIWGAYIWGSLYTGGERAYLWNFTVYIHTKGLIFIQDTLVMKAAQYTYISRFIDSLLQSVKLIN